ncbi:hypothetical protein [Terrabacter sp. C0L_2]|uniref:hypothetical protein n=1 Tax=Terrabacter sp. C0L_2 TaxID=3108389 RepID=UPI002ED41901|nr:hypothetical protein U5C87_17690 [Terrabacter sp. C0L_2]
MVQAGGVKHVSTLTTDDLAERPCAEPHLLDLGPQFGLLGVSHGHDLADPDRQHGILDGISIPAHPLVVAMRLYGGL